MKKIRIPIIMAAALMLPAVPSATAQASEAGVVTAMSEKIYLENSDDSTVLANMLEGSTIEVILTVTDDAGNPWYYVRTDAGLEGYMPAGSVSVAQTQQAADAQVQQENGAGVQEDNAGDTPYAENEDNDSAEDHDGDDETDNDGEAAYTLVTLDNVNIRQEPSVTSGQLGNILKDTEVAYTAAYTNEEGEVWYAVTYQGISGYVTADAVDAGNNAPEPQPWTADTETDAENDAEHDTGTGNLTQTTQNKTIQNQTAQTQAAEQSETVTTTAESDTTDETADIQETQTAEETAHRHGLRLPELFEIVLCAGITACIAAITYIIQKIRLVFQKKR